MKRATEPERRYKSGHCAHDAGVESHMRCRGAYAGAECSCGCHRLERLPKGSQAVLGPPRGLPALLWGPRG